MVRSSCTICVFGVLLYFTYNALGVYYSYNICVLEYVLIFPINFYVWYQNCIVVDAGRVFYAYVVRASSSTLFQWVSGISSALW